MARVSFGKLGLTKNNNVKIIDFNGQTIEVKQYISINDKAILVSNILNLVFGNGTERFANPLQLELQTVLQIIEFYTNISFTDKQKENPVKLYDLITSSGLWDEIINNLDQQEYNQILNYTNKAIDSLYEYYNSVYGILEGINKQYQGMDLDATKISQKLADPENLTFLKDVMTQLG